MRMMLGLVFFLACTGCSHGFFGSDADLRFGKMEFVQAGKSAGLAETGSQNTSGSLEKDNLKITFLSAADLWELAQGSSLNLWYKVRTCGPASIELAGTGVIYWHDIAINQGAMSERQLSSGITAHSGGDKEKVGFEYSVLVKPSAEYCDLGEFEQFAYDLRENPVDLCLQIGGGAMLFPVGFRSKEIVVPREAVIRALSGGH